MSRRCSINVHRALKRHEQDPANNPMPQELVEVGEDIVIPDETVDETIQVDSDIDSNVSIDVVNDEEIAKPPKKKRRFYTLEDKEKVVAVVTMLLPFQCVVAVVTMLLLFSKVQRMSASGMSNTDIARSTGIPRTNVIDWVRNKALLKVGKKNLLTKAEEQLLVDYLILRSRMGMGVEVTEICNIVGEILADDPRSAKLKEGKPSEYNF